MKLHEQIRNMRLASGRSLRSLAKFVELSPSYLSKVERGEVRPMPETMKRIMLAVNFSENEIKREFPHCESCGYEGGDLLERLKQAYSDQEAREKYIYKLEHGLDEKDRVIARLKGWNKLWKKAAKFFSADLKAYERIAVQEMVKRIHKYVHTELLPRARAPQPPETLLLGDNDKGEEG